MVANKLRSLSKSIYYLPPDPTTDRPITIRLPNITFIEKIEVDLGGIHCLVEHVGGNHSADSTVIFIVEEKVLFLGDCLYVLAHEMPLSKEVLWSLKQFSVLLTE